MKILVHIFSLALLFSTTSFASEPEGMSDSYLVCFTSNLNAYAWNDSVSTLVISPEIKGKRYYTSWIGSRTNEENFMARGPQALKSFHVDSESIAFEFEPARNPKSFHFLSVEAEANSNRLRSYESRSENEVKAIAPKKNFFGRERSQPLPSTAIAKCLTKTPAEMEMYNVSDYSNDYKLGDDFIQKFNFTDFYMGVRARSMQAGILLQFVKKLK